MIVARAFRIDGKEVASEALAILAALRDRLRASIALQDFQRRQAHICLSGDWLEHPTEPDETPIGLRDPDGEEVSAPINWRWKLWAAPDDHFAPDAFELLAQAAKKLADLLPAEKLPEAPAPAGGAAGGSSGPAELGIPVEWARKTRN